MATEFYLEPEQYLKHAKTVGEISDKLKRAELRLATLLNAEGNCWGKDETGDAFAKPYSEKGTTVFDNSNAGVKHLRNLSGVMSWAAGKTANRDYHTAETFRMEK